MVSVVRRMVKLRALLDIRLGPGAAILPPNVTKIHMDFAKKINDGHFGPRKFWHTYLPRLKYHNPTVSMSIDRSKDQEGPATMTVYFKDPLALEDSEPKSSTINMKHRHESEILSQLMSLTKATPVTPSSEEAEQLRSLEEHRIQSEKDSARSHEVNEKRKQKEAILAQARGQGSSMQKA